MHYVHTIRTHFPSLLLKILLKKYTPSHRCITVENYVSVKLEKQKTDSMKEINEKEKQERETLSEVIY